MTVNLSALAGAGQQFFSNSGVPLNGGKLYSYAAGTTTPQTTYTTSAGNVAHANPIILNSSGRVATGEIWLTAGSNYKFVLTDSNDVLIATWDNITGINGTGIATNASNVQYDPAGSGAVSTTVQAKLRQVINVLDFGADNTGVNDATTAIQNALNAGAATNQQVVAYGTFRVSSKIVFKGNADFSEATFNVYSTPAVAVEVSTGSAANPTDILNNSVIWLPKRIENMTKPGSGWAGQGIGVRTVNLYSCQIFVGNIVNFATGLLITSYDNGNVYNNYYLGHLENNKINLHLDPGNAGAWTNENNFYGGRYSQYSSEGANVAGCYHIFIDEAVNTSNNNLFIKPSIEGDTPQYQVNCAGAANTIIQGRWECTPPKVNYIGNTPNEGTSNVIAGGYNVEAIVFSYTGAASSFYNQVVWGKTNNYQNVSSLDGAYKYHNGNSSASPVYAFYEAGTYPETATSTQWSVRHAAQYLAGKRKTDAHPRIKLEYVNGYLALGNGTAAPNNFLVGAGTDLFLETATRFMPYPDNTISLGSASLRWSVVYAATGAINTSDGNQKQDVVDQSAAEKRVALTIKGKIKRFRFKDAVQAKGDAARLHFGVIAQDVKAAFEAEGLDASRYGLFCADKLEDGSERLGIRYDELLAFIIGAM